MNGIPSPPRADVARFLAALAHGPNGFVADADITRSRAAFSAMLQEHDAPAQPLAAQRTLSCPGPAQDIPLCLFDAVTARERHARPSPVIVFYHGGGFMLGDLACYASLCSALAVQTGLPVMAIDYRLAPEHPFPAAPDDCEAAARHIAAHPHTFGLPAATGLVLMGDSGGGNLAVVTAHALARTPAALPVVLQVPVYPVTGPVGRHDSYRAYRQGHLLTREALAQFHTGYGAPLDDPRHYPLLCPDLHLAPPTLLVTAEMDPLRDSGREYAAKLAAAGVEVHAMEISGMVHGFMTLRKAIPSAQSDLDRITDAMIPMLERIS